MIEALLGLAVLAMIVFFCGGIGRLVLDDSHPVTAVLLGTVVLPVVAGAVWVLYVICRFVGHSLNNLLGL